MIGPRRGHRTLPHTADVIIEAWGPDFPSCCEEAVSALLGLCIGGPSATVNDRHGFIVTGGQADTMLLELLDEVLFVLDTEPAVPVRASVRSGPGGGLEVELALAERDTIEPVGAVPKAVSWSGLAVNDVEGGVRCSFLVDV
jgi:SHS2 domain-containing protein